MIKTVVLLQKKDARKKKNCVLSVYVCCIWPSRKSVSLSVGAINPAVDDRVVDAFTRQYISIRLIREANGKSILRTINGKHFSCS